MCRGNFEVWAVFRATNRITFDLTKFQLEVGKASWKHLLLWLALLAHAACDSLCMKA